MPGRFARAVPVLGHPVQAGPPSACSAGPPLGASERAGSLPSHFVRTWPFGAFARGAQVPGHFPRLLLGHLARTAQAQPLPVYLRCPPKLGIAEAGLLMAAHYFPSESDRWALAGRRLRRGQARRSQAVRKPLRQSSVELPERRQLIGLPASIDRCRAVRSNCRSAKP